MLLTLYMRNLFGQDIAATSVFFSRITGFSGEGAWMAGLLEGDMCPAVGWVPCFISTSHPYLIWLLQWQVWDLNWDIWKIWGQLRLSLSPFLPLSKWHLHVTYMDFSQHGSLWRVRLKRQPASPTVSIPKGLGGSCKPSYNLAFQNIPSATFCWSCRSLRPAQIQRTGYHL